MQFLLLGLLFPYFLIVPCNVTVWSCELEIVLIHSPIMNQVPISLKNTKQEILSSYQVLLDSAKGVSSEKTDDFRSKILLKVDEIEKYISLKKDEAKDLLLQIEELKQQLDLGKKLKFTLDELKDIEIKIETESKNWERKKKQFETDADDDLEWEKQKFDKELEQKRWEFDRSLDKKSQELNEKQEKFEEKLKEFEALKREVGEFAEVVEKAKKEKEIEITKELEKEFESKKMFLVQETEADKKLLSQKIADLESRLKDQLSENQSLKNQISSLQEKFRDVAVATIKPESGPGGN